MAQIEGTFRGEIPAYIHVSIGSAVHAFTYIQQDGESGESCLKLYPSPQTTSNKTQ